MVASEPKVRGVARSAVEYRVLNRVERLAVLVVKAHANRIGTAVRDQWIVGGQAIENRSRIFGDFGWGEAESSSDCWG